MKQKSVLRLYHYNYIALLTFMAVFFLLSSCGVAGENAVPSDAVTTETALTDVIGGNVYYIAPDGSDSNDGTIERPLATIAYTVAKIAKPGDLILLRGGTYNEGEIRLRTGGEPGKMLTIKAVPGETPVFNGRQSVYIEASNIRIEGLWFENGKAIAVMRWGLAADEYRENIEIVNNTFYAASPVYGYAAIEVSGKNILIEGNRVDINGNSMGTQGHCIYIEHSDNVIIRNNILSGASGYGIHVWEENRGDYPRTIRNITIEDNIIFGSLERSGILIGAGSPTSSNPATTKNIVVRNNLIFNNSSYGIIIYGGSTIANVSIYNNTLFENNSGAFIISSWSRGNITNMLLKNNIFVIKSGYHAANDAEVNPEVVFDHNLYWPGSPNLKNISDANPLTGDPMFIDSGSADFRLQSGSAAVDRGLTLTDVSTDKDGTSRPQGPAYDIGAYEFH